MEQYYRTHMSRIRQAMQKKNIDILFLGFGADFTYLTGIKEPSFYPFLRLPGDWVSGVILGIEKDPILVLQEDVARPFILEQTWIKEYREMPPDCQDPGGFLASVLAEFTPKNKRIAVNKTCWGHTLLGLQVAAPSAVFLPAAEEMLDQVRVVKDELELKWMREAAVITTSIMQGVIDHLKVGMTINDVKLELISQMQQRNVGISFDPGISCMGSHIPLGQQSTGNTKLEPGTTLSFDYGVRVNDYCSDYGRTLFIGEPLQEALDAYACITGIVKDITSKLGDGKETPESLFKYGVDQVKRAGLYDGYYKWGIGHAIGLVVHESPWLRLGANEPLKAGMCLCVEPKIGKPGLYYTRCEDVIQVGEEQGIVLTEFTYEPVIIGA